MSNHPNTPARPKLRFPEFLGSPEWEIKKISNALSYESSALALNKLDFTENGFPVYGADGLVGYIQSFSQEEDYISILKDGSGVGRISFYPGKSSVLGTSGYLKIKDDKTHSLVWLYFLLQTVDFSVYVKGSGIPHLYYSDYSNQAVAIPSLPEQQKIAATLSSLDELLAAQTARLAALQAHKRGLMQALFPADGETVPKLRFPEFLGSPEWEEKKLGEVMVGARLGSNFQSSESDDGTPVIKMGNLNRGVINVEKVEYLTKGAAYNEQDLLKPGDLLFNTRNTLELVGKVAIWNSELPVALYNTNLLRLVFDAKVVSSNYFMNNLFNTQGVLEKLRSIATGTTSVAAIYGKDLNRLMITIPSLPEQQKIADCLSSLDNLITAQSQTIEALKLHKKGLMQGLFPAAAPAA